MLSVEQELDGDPRSFYDKKETHNHYVIMLIFQKTMKNRTKASILASFVFGS